MGQTRTDEVNTAAPAQNAVVAEAGTGPDIELAQDLDAVGANKSGVNPDCSPSTKDPTAGPPSPAADRRYEDIEELVTGHRQTATEEGEEPLVALDFGGIWGDESSSPTN